MAQKRSRWISLGHGDYTDIFSEKDFLSTVKASDRVVCGFVYFRSFVSWFVVRRWWRCRRRKRHRARVVSAFGGGGSDWVCDWEGREGCGEV
ncbi:hypothetical protein CMV_002406 [Castanea mollissima]|uniref:Uncharacterized protein n=1 Tax=Castanea mollissima TaxID=60419 RepID=A0A8J4S1R4_9ROSI|nr:hypothetical protein CMV_002406 [Castanea mollissima]